MSRDVLVRALKQALHAPSAHNTQPWHWQVSADAVRLYADRDRHLTGTDPDGRDLIISCGAALHHLRAALADSWSSGPVWVGPIVGGRGGGASAGSCSG